MLRDVFRHAVSAGAAVSGSSEHISHGRAAVSGVQFGQCSECQAVSAHTVRTHTTSAHTTSAHTVSALDSECPYSERASACTHAHVCLLVARMPQHISYGNILVMATYY